MYELNESHTYEYISCMFENCLSEWNISQNQIIAVVTDNGKQLYYKLLFIVNSVYVLFCILFINIGTYKCNYFFFKVQT